jgi:hypothetical protein
MKQKYCAEFNEDDAVAWKESLPNEIKDWDEVKNAKDSDSFWTQMSNMRSMMGQSIRIPTEDAGADVLKEFDDRLMTKVPSLMRKPDFEDDEVMASFYQQMGRPEDKEKYVAPELSAPEGIVLNESLAGDFKDIAFNHGLSQKQYEGVVKDYTASSVDVAQSQLEAHQQGMSELNKEWGAAFDQNIDRAEAIRSKYFGDVVEDINLAGAPIVKAFNSIAERFGKEGSDNLIQEAIPRSNILAPAEAKERLNEILGNKDHAYWSAQDPAHKDAVDKVVSLTKLAHPDMTESTEKLRA